MFNMYRRCGICSVCDGLFSVQVIVQKNGNDVCGEW